MATFAPGHRLAYDIDGSAVYRYNQDGTANHPPQADWKNINNEASTFITNFATGGIIAVLFPAPVHLKGLFVAYDAQTNIGWAQTIEGSTDTTDGLDGTWTQVEAPSLTYTWPVFSNYRTGIQAKDLPGLVSVRAKAGVSSRALYALHLYVLNQVTFLKIWDPVTDTEIPHGRLDWNVDPATGNPVIVYAGETQPTRQIRVKNIRAQTANGVVVSRETLTDQTPAINAAYQFSLDDVTYANTVNVGNIAPGAISVPVYVRLAPPANQPVTVYATRIVATPTSWT